MPSAKYQIRRKCELCGNTFLAKTLDSKFCSPKCSKKYYDLKAAEAKKLEELKAIAGKVPDARDYISVQEAVAMFGIGRDTMYRLIRRGVIPSINIGKRLTRISKSKLAEMYPLREEPLDKSKPLPRFYSLEPEDCYTIGEIAEKFGFNDSSVYMHIRKYSIPTRQIGNYVYAPKSEIDTLYKDVIRL